MTRSIRSPRVLAAVALLIGAAHAQAQDWPQWRGPNRDNKAVNFTAPKTWPKELTKKWTVSVGEGVSSPVLVGGKVYVFGAQGGEELTTCLDAETGKELWQDKFATKPVTGIASGKGRFVGPRSTPAVADGKICTLGVNGVVSCLDAASGKVLWRKETGSKPQFYTSTSPIIADGKCIVYVDELTAFDLTSGDVKWKWKGGGTPYGSPVLMTVDGAKQVVTPSQGVVAGVSLADGKQLWSFKFPGPYQSTYGTPIIDGPTVIYGSLTGKKGGVTVAHKIEKKSDEFTATELWKVNVAPYEYNTPVLRDGLLFGLSSDMKFFCMDAKTGKELWKDSTVRGKAGGFNDAGTVIDAGSVLIALTGNSELTVFEPSPKTYVELATYKVSSNYGYSYPIVSGNRIFVKSVKDLTLWTIN
jgi:outer membrane protein assembly factor BamB